MPVLQALKIRNAIGMLFPGTQPWTTSQCWTFVILASRHAVTFFEHLHSPPLSKCTSSCPRTGFVPNLTALLSAVSSELSRRLHDITTHPTWTPVSHICTQPQHFNPCFALRSIPWLTSQNFRSTERVHSLSFRLWDTTDPMLPKLRELLFIRTIFNDVPGYDCLTAFLNHRSNIGSEFKLITLVQSTISTDRVARLQSLGVRFVQP